jgi:hypothetical protein
VIGALLAVGGVAGAGWALTAATSRRRPLDVAAALLGPLFILCALAGAVACFVPRLFS